MKFEYGGALDADKRCVDHECLRKVLGTLSAKAVVANTAKR